MFGRLGRDGVTRGGTDPDDLRVDGHRPGSSRARHQQHGGGQGHDDLPDGHQLCLPHARTAMLE